MDLYTSEIFCRIYIIKKISLVWKVDKEILVNQQKYTSENSLNNYRLWQINNKFQHLLLGFKKKII